MLYFLQHNLYQSLPCLSVAMSVCKMWSPGGSPWAAPNGAPMYVKDPCWVWKRVHLGPWRAQSILVWNKPLESGDPSLFGQHIGAPVPHFEHSHRGPSTHRVLAWAWWFQWFHGIGVFCLRLGFCYRIVTYLLSSRSIFDNLILMFDRGLLPWSACTAVVMMNQPQASSSKSFFATLTPGGIFLNFTAMVIPDIAITLGRESVRVLYSGWGTLPTSRQLLWCKEAAATSTFATSEVARQDA